MFYGPGPPAYSIKVSNYIGFVQTLWRASLLANTCLHALACACDMWAESWDPWKDNVNEKWCTEPSTLKHRTPGIYGEILEAVAKGPSIALTWMCFACEHAQLLTCTGDYNAHLWVWTSEVEILRGVSLVATAAQVWWTLLIWSIRHFGGGGVIECGVTAC